jgi:energy-coupling factor transporter transmembrane protein EcfT
MNNFQVFFNSTHDGYLCEFSFIFFSIYLFVLFNIFFFISILLLIYINIFFIYLLYVKITIKWLFFILLYVKYTRFSGFYITHDDGDLSEFSSHRLF